MTGDTTEMRDEQIGALLRALQTPDHAPGFHARLERRLDAEPGRARRGLVLRVAALAAAVAIVGAVVAIGIPRTDKTPSVGGPTPATAATVKRAVRAAYAGLRNMSGTLVADGKRWQFTIDGAGDVRLAGPTDGELMTYDAATGEARSAQKSASLGGDAIFYADRSGVAPGPPDLGPPTWLLPERFGAFVRAALAAHDPAVTETTYDGRPAWRMDVAARPNTIVPEFSGDGFALTVDRDTGMPVRVVELKDGATLHELRIDDLTVDGPVAAGAFRLAFPAGAEVMRSDDGFRRVALDDVEGVVGYAPLVPSTVPAGFRLAEVAVAQQAAPAGAANPESRRVVSLSYRRGLDRFVVTTRVREPGETWTDPFAEPGSAAAAGAVQLRAGALAGAEAHVVVAVRAIPHLWALDGEIVVTVAGDLDRSQLVGVAESLQAR
jgi:hypothetical protein